MGSLESILESKAGARDRVVYTFTVPASIGGEVRTVGMVELTADEEIAVEARCKGVPEKRAVEIVKATVWEVNGDRIHNGAGELDRLWNNLPPKVRTLLNRAWVKLHAADDAEADSFEKSMTARV